MFRTVTLVIVLLTTTQAFGAYSGLLVIPTADVLPPGHVCVDYQAYSPTTVGDSLEAAYLNTQMGVGNRAEAGLDFDFSSEPASGLILNGKFAVRPVDTGLGLAVGSYNIGDQLQPAIYIAATRPISERFRLHCGAQRTPADDTQGFAGVEVSLTDKLWLWLEHLAGEENASAFTAYYQLTDHWGIALGYQRANDREGDDLIVLDIGCVRPTEEQAGS